MHTIVAQPCKWNTYLFTEQEVFLLIYPTWGSPKHPKVQLQSFLSEEYLWVGPVILQDDVRFRREKQNSENKGNLVVSSPNTVRVWLILQKEFTIHQAQVCSW